MINEDDSSDVSCRVCLTQKRRLRSLFQPVDSYTYADILGFFTNVKIQVNDGFSDKICSICCRKAEEAFKFKTLVEMSDNKIRRAENICNDNSPRKLIFSDINDIKVKIECIKQETNSSFNPTEDLKDIKLNFKNDGESITYNNVMIKKVIKAEPKEITFEDFVKDNNINYELPTSSAADIDENDYYDNGIDEDEDYRPPAYTSIFKKYSSKLKKKKRCSKKFKSPQGIHIEPVVRDDILEVKNVLRTKAVRIQPRYLEHIRVVPTKAEPHLRIRRTKKEKKDYNPLRVCPYCARITKTLDRHILQHTGERKYKCTECTNAYLSQAQLKNHLNVHTGIKNFHCDKCPARFHNKILLTSHSNTHKEIKDHICSTCSKAFNRKSGLRKHMIRHSSANKTVKCELCNMTFFEKFQLAHHMRIHTGERPYKCDLCSQPYSYKHDFNRHCFKKHGVFMKRRIISVMNDEVLDQERIAVKTFLENNPGVELPTTNPDHPHIINDMQLSVLFNDSTVRK